MKKGELSINIIIVAAIGLIILVIISVLIFGAGSDIKKGKSCTGLGGVCIENSESCSDYNTESSTYILHPTADCSGEDQKCCIPQ